MQAEEAKTRLDMAQKGASVGIWEWHMDKDIIYWSETTYEIFKYTPKGDFLTNDEFFNLVHPDDRYYLDKALADATKATDINKYEFEYRIIHPDGSVRQIYETGKFYPEQPANPKKMLGILYDITEMRSYTNELKKRQEELTRSNATKDKMFTIISHDLRSPFSGLLGFSELLVGTMKNNDYERGLRYAEIILNSARQTLNLLENLLHWSRVQRDVIEFHPTIINLEVLIAQQIMVQNANIKSKNITVSLFILPDFKIVADNFMVETVIRNLLSNAVKFTSNFGRITISVNQTETETRIAVCDNGVGISEQDIGKLFKIEENYTSIGTNKEKGSGIGLLLCKDFVERHGGRVEVSSKIGTGSTFAFTIPQLLKTKFDLIQTKDNLLT